MKSFDAEVIAAASARSGMDAQTSYDFYKNHVNKANDKGMISTDDFMKVFVETGLSKEQSLTL